LLNIVLFLIENRHHFHSFVKKSALIDLKVGPLILYFKICKDLELFQLIFRVQLMKKIQMFLAFLCNLVFLFYLLLKNIRFLEDIAFNQLIHIRLTDLLMGFVVF